MDVLHAISRILSKSKNLNLLSCASKMAENLIPVSVISLYVFSISCSAL